MRFRFLFIVLFFTTVLHAQEEKSDFETFRKDVLTNYNEFQSLYLMIMQHFWMVFGKIIKYSKVLCEMQSQNLKFHRKSQLM